MKATNIRATQQQLNHRADALNPNKGTSGTNVTNAHVHGDRGKQLNPNQRGGTQVMSPNTPVQPRAAK